MAKTDIILIDPSPNRPGTIASPKKAGCLPHLGLLSIAAVLEKEEYSVKYIDARALGLNIHECCNEVVKQRPRYVGITSITPTISNAASLAEAIKAELDVPIILGGVHVTALPEVTMETYRQFDVAIIGEGEETIVELLKTIDGGESLDNVDGLVYRQGERVLTTKHREMIKDLDTLPLPAWHLLPDITKYYQQNYAGANRLPSNHVMTSRGCYGKCIFCDRSVSGQIVRTHSVDYVLDMIDVLHNKYGIRDITMHDEVFICKKKRINEICDRLIEKKWDLTWSCEARVNNVGNGDLELLKKMKRAGCWRIAYGIESGSQDVLDFIKKDITLEQIERAVKLTREAGIKAYGFFMFGHPTETKERMLETVNLLSRLNITDFGLTYFIPYPGSYSYKIAKKYGHFNDDWETWDVGQPDTFVPYGVTKEELLHYKKLAQLKFYLRPQVIYSWIKGIRSPFDIFRLFMGGLYLLRQMTGLSGRNSPQ